MTLDFRMPKLGESVTEGTIGRWLKQPGDRVEQYEPMLEVTTDKVDTEVSAPIDGVLAAILAAEGETVSVGTVIAQLEPAGQGQDGASEPAPQPVERPQLEPAAEVGEVDAAGTFVSPVVARLAAQHKLDLAAISGTGAGGRVTKRDVQAFLAQHDRQPAVAAAPAQLQQAFEVGVHGDVEPVVPPRSVLRAPSTVVSAPPAAADDDSELVPLSPMRRAIAEHMLRSKQTAPHVTTVMEADLGRIVAHRERNRADWERQGVKLSFTPYFVQATVAALADVPQLNSSWSDGGIVQHRRINVGVAVALDDGLLVPVIKDAGDRSLLGIARAVAELAERARNRRLSPDDTRDGTFTVTNHGVWGSLFATPVINQPQTGILGIGAIQKRVVVLSENGVDSFAIRPMCYLSLTFDHRVVDGATADRFLAAVKRALETYET